jgi:hypothetical protein
LTNIIVAILEAPSIEKIRPHRGLQAHAQARALAPQATQLSLRLRVRAPPRLVANGT